MSEANVRACAAPEAAEVAPIAPLTAMGRERHHLDPLQRFAPEPLGPEPQEPLAAMAHRLNTREGGALYALRRLGNNQERCSMHSPRPLITPSPTGCQAL